MQKNRIARVVSLVVVSLMVMMSGEKACAQQGSGSGNLVFSPYTMYGIGDLYTQGTASSMAMGGVGIAIRSAYEINYQNPASLSAIPQKSALFSFGGRATNMYSKTEFASTAHNSIDLSDVGFAVPLYRGIGLSFSLQPVSVVGFNSTAMDDNSEVIENIGRAVYNYAGEGGISMVNMGLGVMVAKGFSLGANLSYYFGNIDRYYNAEIVPLLGQTTDYRNVKSSDRSHISHILASFGAQYSHRVGKMNAISIGVTYQPRTQMKADKTDFQGIEYMEVVDTVSYSRSKYPITIPSKFAVGLSYMNQKLVIGLDYAQQNWKNAFAISAAQNITLRTQQDYKFGIAFTPDRSSITSQFKRWTYKLGLHYSTSYLMKDNTKLEDMGISLGVDVPLKQTSFSKISIGVDFGKRGTLKVGQVQENYFKVFAGLTLFGDDYWFVRQKFD